MRLQKTIIPLMLASSIFLTFGLQTAVGAEDLAAPATTPSEVGAALADADVTTSSSIATTTDSDSAVTATTGGVLIDVPRDGEDATKAVLGDGQSIGFALPGAEDASAVKVGADATAYVAEDGTAQVANVTGTPELPALQFLTTIPSADAPREYRYEVALPTGTSLTLTDERGLAVVNQDGAVLAAAPPAWVKDANGVEIADGARFRVEGNAVVMEVDVHRVEAFPATADPIWFLAARALWPLVRAVAQQCLRNLNRSVALDMLVESALLGRGPSPTSMAGSAVSNCLFNLLPHNAKRLIRR